MKKNLSLCAFILWSIQVCHAQSSNFAIGMRYGSETESYKNKKENAVLGQVTTTTLEEQNHSFGVLMRYTLKKRLIFETGVSWIRRDYEQLRPFDEQSFAKSRGIDPLFYTSNYSYQFIEIPFAAKVNFGKKANKLKPFLEFGAKAAFLMNANYTSSGRDYSDAKQAFWGWSSYGGFGLQYFWKNFIFETHLHCRFNQKFKGDSRFFKAEWLKYEDNNTSASSLGCTIYRNFDFKKAK